MAAAVEEGEDIAALYDVSHDVRNHDVRHHDLSPSTFYSRPYTFIKESLQDRRRKRLVRKTGISPHPRRERLLMNGHHGNWMTSWFRSGLRRGDVHTSGDVSEETSRRHFTSQLSNDDLFLRSTGEIHDGQTDDFVFLSDDLSYHDDDDVMPVVMETHVVLANLLWRPALSFHPFTVGDAAVSYESLWPANDRMKTVLIECVSGMRWRRYEVIDVLLLSALRCGPLTLLRSLLELGLTDVHHTLDEGKSLLHVACIAGNFDACLYLCTLGAERKVRDRRGRKPYHVCTSPRIRKLLPSPSTSRPDPGERPRDDLSRADVQRIFTLLDEDEDEALWRLQSRDVDVNDLVNDDGDYIVHVLAKKGLTHLSTLLCLSRVRPSLSINQCNLCGLSALMVAALHGHLTVCDMLMCVLGADPNLANPRSGETALHYAARHGHLDTVCRLLQRGVDPGGETSDSLRADDVARSAGHTDCATVIAVTRETRRQRLSLLVRQGSVAGEQLYNSDLCSVDLLGDTLLMTATRHDRIDNLQILLSRKKNFIDAQNMLSGKPAVSIAASLGLTDAAELLVRSGAALSVVDMAGYATLHHAVLAGHEMMTELILALGDAAWHDLKKAIKISPTVAITRLLQEAHNRRQEMVVSPALLEGAITGNVDVLYETLEEGDDVNPLSGEGNWPAFLAAASGHLVVLDFLAKNGGDIWGQHEVTLNTALHAAASRGHTDILTFLLRHYGYGGQQASHRIMNMKNGAGYTALQLAAQHGFASSVELLLDQGASTSVLDPAGRLYHCHLYDGIELVLQEARSRHLDQLVTAITHHKNPVYKLKQVYQPSTDHNLRTPHGDSPLHIACHHGNLEVVKYLLHSNTDCWERLVEERNEMSGDSVLHSAVRGGDHVGVVRLLLSINLSLINTVNRQGCTALHLACTLGRRQVVEKLTAMPDIDVDITDCHGYRPDDVTNNSALRHMVASVRRRQSHGSRVSGSTDLARPFPRPPPSSPPSFHTASSSVDFDELNKRFLQVKYQQLVVRQVPSC